MPAQRVNEIRAIVGADSVLTDAAALARYGVDRTSFWPPAPALVVLPNSVEQVRELVRLANRHRLAMVPSGGRTGLSGGAVAAAGEIVLSMERMNRLLDFNPVDATLTCEAGMVTARVQEIARSRGFYYPVDYAVVHTCHIGGNIATNAGGIKVIRYGSTREWVLGLKVVTGAGHILECNRGLVKNNSGYDFRHLFIGSEGTLGVICEATLKLERPPNRLTLLVLGLSEFDAVLGVLRRFRRKLELTAFEFFADRALVRVLDHTGLRAPLAGSWPFYALVEFDQRQGQERQQAEELVRDAIAAGEVQESVFAENARQFADYWRLRSNISESLAAFKPYKNDLSVTVARMPAFMRAADALVRDRYRGFETVWFGHVGDGNLHLNVLKPDDWSLAAFVDACSSVNRELVHLVAQFGGSISAEHGIGLLKRDYLEDCSDTQEIELMRQVKGVFDPEGIMNPGKIFTRSAG